MVDSPIPCLQELPDEEYNDTWRAFPGDVLGSVEIDLDIPNWRCGEYDDEDDEVTLHIRCAQALGVNW